MSGAGTATGNQDAVGAINPRTPEPELLAASEIMGTEASPSRMLVACIAYGVAGPLLILLNQHILVHLQFPYPVTLCGLGMIFSAAAAWLYIHVWGVRMVSSHVTVRFYLTHIAPIGLLQALAMALGNWAYLRLTVSFVEMLKAFTPVITLMITFAFGVAHPTARIWIAVIGISLGTCVAVYGEHNFDLVGVLIFMLSALSEAARLVLSQFLLRNMQFGVIEGLYFMAPAGALGMILVALVVEVPNMVDSGAVWLFWEQPYMFVAGSTLGLGINLLSNLIIQASSAVMLKVIGTARTAGLVLFCAFFLGEAVTRMQFLGYSLSLVSFLYYNYLQFSQASNR